MNGTFFVLDDSGISSMTGKYISHYNNTWVLSKEPERSESAGGYGTPDEWEVLYDLQAESWLPVPEKSMSALGTELTITGAQIVDINSIGPMADYVVRYKSTDGQMLYYRDQNIDGVFSTKNYSVYNVEHYSESILGPYGEDQAYIQNFNNSVMLYENIRLGMLGNAVVAVSYTVDRERIGTLLIPYGDIFEDYFPVLFTAGQKIYLILKTAGGYIRIIRIGTDIPDRITRMAQYVHKINTLDVYNIIVEREGRITVEPGSLDWNNKFEIVNRMNITEAQTMETYHVNSAYNPLYETTGKRSSSMIVSSTTFTLYGKLYNDALENTYSLRFINARLVNDRVDVFFDTVNPPGYKYSLENGEKLFDSRLEGLSFPNGVIVPFPLGTIWNMQNEVTAIGQTSKDLLASGLTDSNKTMDIYEYSRQFYFGKNAFSLYGIQYVFDGDYVYQADAGERISMAFGYLFIGCDNKSAYFYNTWDKSVYQFTGSRDLVKVLNLSNRSAVKAGRFDGFSGEMILLTENEILKTRENTSMDFPAVPGDTIIPTKEGGYIKLESGDYVLLSPLSGTLERFELITEFIGVDGSTVCDFERVDVRLFSLDKKQLSFTAALQTINQDTKQSEEKRITVNGNDWSEDGYKTIKFTPRYKKGSGLSLKIASGELINLVEIAFTYDPVARTANSQRSGY
jgi:hypothetical protein